MVADVHYSCEQVCKPISSYLGGILSGMETNSSISATRNTHYFKSAYPTSSHAWAARNMVPAGGSDAKHVDSICMTSVHSLLLLCTTIPFITSISSYSSRNQVDLLSPHCSDSRKRRRTWCRMLISFTTDHHEGGFLRSKCDICGKAAKGFGFRCTTCSFEMHPCCAAMRVVMNFPTHQHPLVLSPSAAVATGDPSTVCSVCQRNRSGRVYRCAAACGYCLHAVCAKDIVNGLYVHGLRSPDKPNNMLGTAAKLATQALVGIIGGLVEGIGEGIGSVLMDSIGRGSCRSIKHN
ncbi:hypothetical protein B296_00045385 [Ensete ventricosum]|uniref:DC1 domain-containing protein n=1 Tax=Ensete ventricosum TaxID=4639 RepID=A0A426Z7M1_ENSVE|nr:hypothetical protein B296_00045385 [Ensete ventricosum]